MKFRKGDRVRFLDEKGEGIISRLLGEGMAMVEIEDGFEYPYPVAQLVPVNPIAAPEPAKPQTTAQAASKPSVPTAPAVINTRYPDGIYLAFVPQHQAFPSAGKIDLILFNHSTYDIYYTLSLKDGSLWTCIQAGMLGPGRQIEVETLTPQDIDNWGSIKTDVLFYSDDAYEHRAPVSNLLRLKGTKFFKDSTYGEHLLTGKKSFVAELVPLYEKEAPAEESKPFLTQAALRNMLATQEQQPQRGHTSKPALKNQQLEKEVDLHIEELLDNWNGMTNGQLLDIQLRRMQQELDQAMADHLQRIIFIHGVGNGRLKTEIRRVLGTYKGIRFYDASYQRYGFGATEVMIYG
ncbi:MAG: DUF2027 domain-containing protein [Bacteroidia bacterium]|jgi:hypothetical protein|nr:DUF2027 domain-containing protein [Bacteroidia bacterium]